MINYTLHFFISFVDSLMLLGLIIYYVINKHKSKYFIRALVSGFTWVVINTLIYIIPNETISIRINTLKYIGIAFSSVFIYLFINSHVSNSASKTKKIILYIIPTLTTVFTLFDFKLHFIFSSIRYSNVLTQYIYTIEYGVWFYVIAVNSCFLLFASFLEMFEVYFLVTNQTRKSIFISAVAIILITLTGILSITVLYYVTFDITVNAFTISMFLFYISIRIGPNVNYLLTSKEYILNNVRDIMLVIGNDNKILSWNKAGYNFIIDLELEPLKLDYDFFYSRWVELKKASVSKYNPDIISYFLDDKEYHFKINQKDIFNDNFRIGSFIEISEITDMFSLYRSLEATAHFDYLTGLYNRNAYIEKIASIDNEINFPIGIISLDVNLLKKINDTQGHLVGDELLTAVSRIIKYSLPPNSFLARIGGDEFMALLPNSNKVQCTAIITEIEKQANNYYSPSYGIPSIAMGYYLKEDNTISITNAIDEADKSMYINKKERRLARE